MRKKKIFVSGCFDMLHSGHVYFLQKAATYGDLYVAIGSDSTIYQLKDKNPVCSEAERLYLISSLKCVKEAFISNGSGILDFIEEFKAIEPDIFVVNSDGDKLYKRDLCNQYNTEYIICDRDQYGDLDKRSSTLFRQSLCVPFRIEICGGWIDQPFVSTITPGSVINMSIEPNLSLINGSGIASSTRQCAYDLWRFSLPQVDPQKAAMTLFAYENFPGKSTIISGSQDAIGIVYPGVHNLYYDGSFWPSKTDIIVDTSTLEFLESHIFLYYLGEKEFGYSAVAENAVDIVSSSISLASAANECWESILSKDVEKLGKSITDGAMAKNQMFPGTIPSELIEYISNKSIYGYGLTGTGFGGYAIIVADVKPENCLDIKIRKPIEITDYL
jgi:cytidyltransferase-like protein